MGMVLVAFERFGVIREAFRSAGHTAFSCDLAPDESGVEKPDHMKLNAEDVLGLKCWDLIIMHPPCTALAVSGNAHYAHGQAGWDDRLEAVRWTKKLWQLANTHGTKVCMENPVGVLPKMAGLKCTQYIQPWHFGHPESKKTGLWLNNLPKLQHTNVLEMPECGYWDNQTPSGQNKLGPSEGRAMARAKTYQGIAQAMVDQWGPLIPWNNNNEGE